MRQGGGTVVAALIAVVAGTIGCATVVSPSVAPPSHAGSGGVVPSPPASATPDATPPPSTRPSLARPTPDPTLAPPFEQPLPEPPPALLITPDETATAGELGTYIWRDGGQDAPWLPADALAEVRVMPGDVLRLASGAAFTSGSADIAPAEDESGRRRRRWGALRGARAGVPVVLDVPPPGSWVLAVQLRYGELGEATWYWRIRTG